MTSFKHAAFLLALAAGVGSSSTLFAQGFYDWVPTGADDWNDGANWDGAFPDAVPFASFGDAARIGNGGTAEVLATPQESVGAVEINDGGVTIGPGATLTTEENTTANAAATGNFDVNGGGNLRVVGGGELVVGVDLNLGGTLTAELTATPQIPVSVAGQANLGGALVADINGATVNSGSTWNLIDATSLTGNFASVTNTGTPLSLGQSFNVEQIAGAGNNGNLVQLSVEQRLVLNVNRETRIASIENVGTSAVNIDFDNYLIQSANGSMNPSNWDSLEDQGFQGGAWFEAGIAGSTMTALSEFNPTSSATLAPGASHDLGTIYAPNYAAVPISGETEDYTFSYTNNGETFEGIVNYVGDRAEHNLVLTVDPTTGDAILQNESGAAINFDSYSIASEDNALLTTWDSIEGQGAPGATWLEANPSANRLSELAEQGSTTLNQNEGFDFGTLLNTSIPTTEDKVSLQFILTDTDTVIDGVVVFGDLPTNLLPPSEFNPGDFNQDGFVNAADYTTWRNGLGTTYTAADYLVWRNNYGAGSGSGSGSVAPVPEPASGVLAVLAVLATLQCGRRRS